LRQYLRQPHVARYFRAERQVVLDAICAGNPVALRTIRDEARNQMAAVAAVRGLELMRNEDQEGGPGRFAPQSPGVTIVIEAAPGRPAQVIGSPPLIDARHRMSSGHPNCSGRPDRQPFKSSSVNGLRFTSFGSSSSGISAHHAR
jgi:hypothetical protein